MLRAAIVLAIAMLPLTAFAQSYRCVGTDGKKYYGSTIPPQCYGRPVEQISEPRHANSRGAGFLGFLSTGDLALSDLEALVPVRRCFEPVNSALFDERLTRHRELNSRLRLRSST